MYTRFLCDGYPINIPFVPFNPALYASVATCSQEAFILFWYRVKAWTCQMTVSGGPDDPDQPGAPGLDTGITFDFAADNFYGDPPVTFFGLPHYPLDESAPGLRQYIKFVVNTDGEDIGDFADVGLGFNGPVAEIPDLSGDGHTNRSPTFAIPADINAGHYYVASGDTGSPGQITQWGAGNTDMHPQGVITFEDGNFLYTCDVAGTYAFVDSDGNPGGGTCTGTASFAPSTNGDAWWGYTDRDGGNPIYDTATGAKLRNPHFPF